ncbi:hypothetical protein JJB09_01905 [Rhizobium sp. KVB221]|uniref:Uncharacterized protein n=1 Tax=Rhizobium setariae TaxID=2801340 RepID=A0A936YJK4_9HYPH|nr:plant virulence effector HPE1-like domain-containing protein [Rhizobium setariae]MBL0370773.1 hypothetical protein [Rhizobium setariae]
MRVLIFSGTVVLAAAAAQAASIDEVATNDSERSIEHVSCATCPPLKSRIRKQAVEITLEPGTQKVEIRDVDGVKKIFRTEAWMGGSPVVFVSKAPEQETDANVAVNVDGGSNPITAPVTIDKDATTSAVTADMTGEADNNPTPKLATTTAFAPEQMELRLK